MKTQEVLQMKIRCVCGHVSKVLQDEKVLCTCGRTVWFEKAKVGSAMRPWVSGDPYDAPMRYNRPRDMEFKWVEVE